MLTINLPNYYFENLCLVLSASGCFNFVYYNHIMKKIDLIKSNQILLISSTLLMKEIVLNSKYSKE